MPLQIAINQTAINAFCEKWGITEFEFCGSVIRDDFRPDSDVDVLARFAEDSPITLLNWCDAEKELAEIFGRKTDLIDKSAVEKRPNYIRQALTLRGDMRYTKDDARLLDMLDFARGARRFTDGFTFEEFRTREEKVTSMAYIVFHIRRLAEVVTEAKRATIPGIEWRRYLGFDNLILSAESQLNPEDLWKFAREESQVIISNLEPIIPKYD